MAVSTAVVAAAAATAYLDAKFHFSQDLLTIRDEWKVEKIVQSRAQAGKLSLWYAFEEQALRLTTNICLWYRISPDQPARTYTWSETYQQTCRWAVLLRKHNVLPGELVSLYLRNCPDFVFVQLACWAIGCAPALVSFNLRNEALIFALRAAPSKLLVVDDDEDCRKRIEDLRARIERELDVSIVIVDNTLQTRLSNIEATRPEDSLRDNVTLTSPVVVWYTSGTTGFPKACSFQVSKAYALGLPRLRTTGVIPGDVWYVSMPMFHGTANTIIWTCMTMGVSLAIAPRFSTRSFWRDIYDSGAAAFVYVGEIARYLLAAPPSPFESMHKLKAMHGNGLRPDVWSQFQQRFNIPVVHEMFSSSEGGLSLLNPSRGDFFASAVGRHGLVKRWLNRKKLVPVKIDYENGGQVWRSPETGFAERTDYNEGGEILVQCKSPSQLVFPGYWKNPEATAKRLEHNVFQEGDCYYRTGDALRRDEDGRWFFIDRLGDTFRWKSENVSTAEVSKVLGAFPGLMETNVYGVLIPKHDGRAGCAAITIQPHERERFDFDRLLSFAKDRLPSPAIPVFLRLRETPALTNIYKQDKKVLREESVDPDKISRGEGRGDKVLWLKDSRYVPFTLDDWNMLAVEKARL